MVCETAQGTTEKKYPKMARSQKCQGLETSPQKSRVMAGSAAQSKVPAKKKRHRKTQRDFKIPAVPEYRLAEGTLYDVYDSHKSAKGVKYSGYEIIGHLVLHCFLDGEHPYKFSETALRMYGKVTESVTGAEILPEAGAGRGAI